MIKKVTITLFLSFYLILASLYFIFNTPWVLERAIPFWVNSHIQEVKITVFKIGHVQFKLPGTLYFKQVKFLLADQKKEYSFDLPDVQLFLSSQKMDIKINNVWGTGPILQIKKASLTTKLNFVKWVMQSLSGELTIDGLDLYQYQLTNIRAKLEGDRNRIQLNDVRADFCDGSINGKIGMDYSKQMAYSIETELTQVNLSQLKSVNPAVFSKVQGRVNGHLSIEGDIHKLHSIKSDFSAPSGGQVKASVLGYLIKYIPKSVQKDDLESLVGMNGDIPFETADLQLESVSDRKLINKIILKSKKFDINLNLKVDINMEGGLNNLLNFYFKKLSR